MYAIVAATALLTSGCGEPYCDTCLRIEDASDGRVAGTWSGTYDAGNKYLLGENPLSLTVAPDGAYTIHVYKDRGLSGLVFDSDTMTGYGFLTTDDMRMRVRYDNDEVWTFTGAFYASGQVMATSGRISDELGEFGTWELTRDSPRQCLPDSSLCQEPEPEPDYQPVTHCPPLDDNLLDDEYEDIPDDDALPGPDVVTRTVPDDALPAATAFALFPPVAFGGQGMEIEFEGVVNSVLWPDVSDYAPPDWEISAALDGAPLASFNGRGNNAKLGFDAPRQSGSLTVDLTLGAASGAVIRHRRTAVILERAP